MYIREKPIKTFPFNISFLLTIWQQLWPSHDYQLSLRQHSWASLNKGTAKHLCQVCDDKDMERLHFRVIRKRWTRIFHCFDSSTTCVTWKECWASCTKKQWGHKTCVPCINICIPIQTYRCIFIYTHYIYIMQHHMVM